MWPQCCCRGRPANPGSTELSPNRNIAMSIRCLWPHRDGSSLQQTIGRTYDPEKRKRDIHHERNAHDFIKQNTMRLKVRHYNIKRWCPSGVFGHIRMVIASSRPLEECAVLNEANTWLTPRKMRKTFSRVKSQTTSCLPQYHKIQFLFGNPQILGAHVARRIWQLTW